METANHECYVSLEVAKLLKKAGFDWEVNHSYPDVSALDNSCSGYMEDLSFYHNLNDGKYGGMSAPTLEIAQRWLRKTHHLHITIFSSSQESWMFRITKPHEKIENGAYGEDFYTYEEAQEAGIKKALEIILEKGE